MDKDIYEGRANYILRFLDTCKHLKQRGVLDIDKVDVLDMDREQVAAIIDYIGLCDTCAVNSRDFEIVDIMTKHGCTYKQAEKIRDVLMEGSIYDYSTLLFDIMGINNCTYEQAYKIRDILYDPTVYEGDCTLEDMVQFEKELQQTKTNEHSPHIDNDDCF